ncbi:MAG: hypothetical protein KBC17_00305 [Candidatus Pacebacteria bacterium]|nr:hypothetical protein [Candidatus Paceibacterota bacterium]
MKNTFPQVHPLNQGLASMMFGGNTPAKVNRVASLARAVFNTGNDEQKEQTLEILNLGGSSIYAQMAYHPSNLCLDY